MWETLLAQALSTLLPLIVHALPSLVADATNVANIINHGEGGAAKVAAAAAALAKVAGDAGADVSMVASAVSPYTGAKMGAELAGGG
ncbi:MAG TPA: hypothetical protein VNE82_03550 [Candidatus Binataceae bacterium]|nr:hypothetical protein [Candidatus Binataceae bacterium]